MMFRDVIQYLDDTFNDFLCICVPVQNEADSTSKILVVICFQIVL